MATGEFGLFVSLGTFTRQATEFARSKGNLRLVDAKALIELVLEHYDAFDAKYKGILSLKSVFIPEQVEQEDED